MKPHILFVETKMKTKRVFNHYQVNYYYHRTFSFPAFISIRRAFFLSSASSFLFFINRNEFPLLFFVVIVIKPQTGISIYSILVSSFLCNLLKECTKKYVERQKYADYICERNFRVLPWFVSNKFQNANS